jgi:hypothetical protein
MFVYPVRSGVPLPEAFDLYAEVPAPEELMPLPGGSTAPPSTAGSRAGRGWC